MRILFWANLILLILFPVAWAAPLMRAGLLPWFGLEEISVLTGLSALWEGGEWVLAILIAIFALLAPIAKTLALMLLHLGKLADRLSERTLAIATLLGKLAMADIFLISLYIMVGKGLAVGRLETAWGLWLFTACVLGSLAVSIATARQLRS